MEKPNAIRKDGTCFISSYRNTPFLTEFFQELQLKTPSELTELIGEFRGNSTAAGCDTIIVEVSSKAVREYSPTTEGQERLRKLIYETQWGDGNSPGAWIAWIDYEWMINTDVSPIRYPKELGRHTYFHFRYIHDPDFYRAELDEDLRLFKVFTDMVDKAITDTASRQQEYTLIHVPLLSHGEFLGYVNKMVEHHNTRVCRLKPATNKVRFYLEHHENGHNDGELGSLMLNIVRA